MLTEKEIAQLKAGAYGVTRDGCKVLYAGKDTDDCHQWLHFHKSNPILPHTFVNSYDCFDSYYLDGTHPNDIVGLWKDKPEPFNLKRALAGEMIVENNVHYWLVAQSRANKDKYIIQDLEGSVTICRLDELYNKFTMWKKPEPVKPSADSLPKPIREFGDLEEVWFIEKHDNVYKPKLSEIGCGWATWQMTSAKNGCYYATKEDCRAVCNWLMNR